MNACRNRNIPAAVVEQSSFIGKYGLKISSDQWRFHMNALTKDTTSTFYRDMLRLALPIVLQNLITTAVSSADVVMLGFVNQTALAAGSLASQIMFILNLVYTGISSGIIMLAAQYWGKRTHVLLKISWGLVCVFLF